jgi:hypothetical protein
VATLTPVDHDPFAAPAPSSAGPKLTPVENDPFASQPPPQPKPSEGFHLFGTKPAMDPVFHALAAPVINFLDYPARAGVADVIASIPGIGALPTDKQSRDKWQRIRDQIVEGTALPENAVGKAISSIASIPGTLIGSGVHAASEKLLGKETTAALGPYAQTAADILPFGHGAIKREVKDAFGVKPPTPMQPRPAVPVSAGAGYKLSPEMVTESPGLVGRVLSAGSGLWKKWQELSYENQANTDRLAATSVGLPADTHLTEAAFDRAKQPAIQAYENLDASVPNIALAGDAQFRRDVDGLTAQRGFIKPSEAENPEIARLKQELLSNPTASPKDVRESVADLRFKAGKNLRAQGNVAANELGMAQRHAADLLEDAIERSIKYGPEYVKALTDFHAAQHELERHQRMAAGSEKGAPVDVPAMIAERARAAKEAVRASIARPPGAQAQAAKTLTDFQAARQLFARISDLELATNLADGHVSARRVSALRSGPWKKPLGDELKHIADAYDAFPKVLQDPKSFGDREAWSIIDLWAGGTALAAGHPLFAAATASRHPLRRALASDWYQRRLQDRYRNQVTPPPPVMSPFGSGYLQGTLLQPQTPSPLLPRPK